MLPTFTCKITDDRCNEIRLLKLSVGPHSIIKKRTLNASTISCGLMETVHKLNEIFDRQETYHTVLVIAVPADGAITLAIMLYFLPSIARVFVRPMMPAFAVEY